MDEEMMERQMRAGDRNEMEICFDAISENESFARVAVAAFVSRLNPTLEELSDIKTAVSEAVTNAIIHGYGNWGGYFRHAGSHRHAGSRRHAESNGRGSSALAGCKAGEGKVRVYCLLENGVIHIKVIDEGRGIENIEQAMEPLFTTRPEWERSGMGFAFMEAFMDELEVESALGKGTTVCMSKKINAGAWIGDEE